MSKNIRGLTNRILRTKPLEREDDLLPKTKGSNIFSRHFNGDVLNTGLNLFWRTVSGPITLLLIPLFTSPRSQGFWYTFLSLAMLTTLTDLGFTTIVTQFVAHEFAFLSIDRDGLIRGDPEQIGSTGALMRFVIRWALFTGLIVMPMVFGIGFYLFVQKAEIRVWLLPWGLFCVGTLLNYWSTMLASFVQGARQVAQTQRLTFISKIVQTAILYSLLVARRELLALSISTLAGGALLSGFLIIGYSKSLRQLLCLASARKWGAEVMTLLWRYALSWVGGYLNMGIYTPLAFQLKGAVVAGKVGITMALWNAALGFATTWFSANIPKINILVEQHHEMTAGKVIRDLWLLSILTYAGGIAGILAILYFGPQFGIGFLTKVSSRIMTLKASGLFIAANAVNLSVVPMAIYVRAHKEEPFMLPSLLSGFVCTILTIVVMVCLDSNYLFLGFLLSWLLHLPWYAKIYLDKRTFWRLQSFGQDGATIV